MRRIAAHIEDLTALAFILLIGLVGGAIQGILIFFLGGTSPSTPHLAQFIVVGISAVLWWTAALLLWWIAIRRRRWSLWATAAHVTLGLALGDVLASALSMVVGSIETNGMVAGLIAREPMMFVSSNLMLPLMRSPLWFLGSAVAIALGRHLSAGQRTVAPSQSPTTAADPVT